MHRLAHLISRVADAHMRRLMDQAMRVGLLEGIAGVPYNSWKHLHPPVRGLMKAQERLAKEGLDPAWFSEVPQGLYMSTFLTARSVLKDAERAEEIVQDIIANLSRSKDVEGGQLYDLGKNRLRQDPSIKHAIGMMKMHAKHRALALLRGPHTQSLTDEGEEGGGPTSMDVPTKIDSDDVQRDLISFLSDPKGGALFQVIRRVLGREWATSPGKLQILDTLIADPSRSAVDIAHILKPGVEDNTPGSWVQLGAATYVSKTIREIQKRIPEIALQTPGLLQHLHLEEELAGLGYGASSSRWARSAKNLVRVLNTKYE